MRMFSLGFQSYSSMIPLKWKVYRVLNYLLLCCGVIFLLNFLRVIINSTDLKFVTLLILSNLLFLFMAVHSLINIIIMSKTFPDKILDPRKTRWHIFSLVLNLISLVGLIITLFSVVSELNNDYFDGLLIIFVAISILVLSSMFVLTCQFNLRKYLKQKNASLMNSLIDSIGSNTESPE